MSVSNHDTKVAIDLIIFFRNAGLTDQGIAALLGNFDKESTLRLNNLQNSGNTKLGISDEEYTRQVDAKERNFIDSIGYGIAQWTSSGRKQTLFNVASVYGVSIGSEKAQFECVLYELNTTYKKTVLPYLVDPSKTVEQCAKRVMIYYEAPKDLSEANQEKRAKNARDFYNLYFPETIMSIRDNVINVAKGLVGTMESPANSNKVIFNQHYYGSNKSAAWCCIFMWDVFRLAEASKTFYNGGKTSSCTTLLKHYISKTPGLVSNKLTNIVPGDIVFFQTKTNSTKAQHVGLVIGVDHANNTVDTIEGNTSATDKGSQDNGGIVAVKKRTFTNKTMWIYKLVHVVYEDEKPMNPYSEPTSTLYKGCPKGEPVKWLQWELNRHNYICTIDGSFGGTTDRLVRAFQSDNKLTVDGRVGGKTRTALKS